MSAVETSEIREIIVVGGGISGLSVAWNLARAGREVTLLEAAGEVGGCMRSERRDGFLLEKGPFNVMVRDPAFEELLADLEGEIEVVEAAPAARARFIYSRGRLVEVPTSALGFATTGLLSLRARLRAARGLVLSRRGSGAPTIEDFAVRRLGRGVAENLVSAAVAGIYAGDISALGMYECFPFARRFDTTARSPLLYALGALRRRRRAGRAPRRWKGMVSLNRGLGGLAAALGRKLGAGLIPGCRLERLERAAQGFELHCRVARGEERLLRARRVVLALPLPEARRVLAPLAPAAAEPLAAIESASLSVLNLAFRREDVDHPLRGFGFLVPRTEEEFPLMGVLWPDSVFPHHGRPGFRLMRVFLGGARCPDVTASAPGELTATALKALEGLLGLRNGPALVDCSPYPDAIPQYRPGHGARIERLRRATADVPGLHLAGNYLEGVSINDCARLGREVALEVLASSGHAGGNPSRDHREGEMAGRGVNSSQ